MNGNQIIKLLVSIIGCQLAGVIGGLFTAASVKTWYSTIIKPSFNPPNWIFGPVWISLYLMMGLAFFLVWTTKLTSHKTPAMILFVVQLLLNILWSYSFFYLRNPLAGLVVIIILLVFILLTVWQFFLCRPLAGYLMVPYILWVSFATFLNYSIWKLNS